MSWVSIDDTVGIIKHVLATSSVNGPVNVVAPGPVQNADFTAVLARVLRRPALFPAPPFALRLALGEMANALLLSSQKVLSKEIRGSGYLCSYQALEPALRSVLGR
jgi:NAD dependent epimerase/dehydratase family enzyme